jgi:NAD(P)-dependent dehydrogenase (short-subunit alcohol dehydrogenase family)
MSAMRLASFGYSLACTTTCHPSYSYHTRYDTIENIRPESLAIAFRRSPTCASESTGIKEQRAEQSLWARFGAPRERSRPFLAVSVNDINPRSKGEIAMSVRVADFNGKNVYIVGGSSGIGLATAKQLSQLGSNVLIFARGRERLEEALRQITSSRKAETQRFAFKQMDVSVHDEVKRVMDEAVEEFGPPDILINSAGRALPDYFENISYEQFDETMKLHTYGIWNTVSTLLPYMKQKGGYIVNVSSLLGFMGVFGYSDYCPSKFAILGLSEVLKSELKQYNIGISVLCPPDTDTPGFEVENRTKPPETVAVSEGGGLLQPEEVAQALIKGMRKGKYLIGPGSVKTVHFMKRHFPWLVDMVMDRQIKKVQKGSTR